MKRSLKWGIGLLAVLLIAGALGRAVVARKAAGAAATPGTAPVALELTPADVATASRRELQRTLEITGAIKAVDSAVVKAKVAAELQSLSVREGDRVVAGQVLGRLDATEYDWKLRQAREQAAQAQAQLDIAERALDNNKALVDQGFISKNALDTSVSNAAAARAALQAANAAAELARKAQGDTVLRAPIAGWVSQRLAQPGERVAIDAKVVEIVDLSRLEIEAALPAEDVGAVRIGAAAQLQVDGFTEPVQAQVVRINPAAQAGTRAVMVYLRVEPQPGLRQGLFARGRIELERKTTLAMPAAALRVDQARPYALAVVDGKVVQRVVSLGARGLGADGKEPLVEIAEGLDDGVPLLRGTVGGVREGTLVKLTAPAGNAAAAAAAAGGSAAAGAR